MVIGRQIRQGAIAAAVMVTAAGLQAAPASAQLFWDWGGGTMIGGSGREVVRFSPQFKTGEVIVSFSDRRLYFVSRPGEAFSYPIAIPRDQSRWQGVTSVSQKRVNPPWTPTPTMIAENPRLPRWVPGGHPMNPLGVRALYLGSSTYRIHGTDAPWTIGSAVSKGCIRMYNEDVLDLYPRVNVGARVTVTWQRFNAVANTGWGPPSASEERPTPKAPMRRASRAKSASAE
jgi:lipoprotein-anchoring transpeptidase ErfK/SrfK